MMEAEYGVGIKNRFAFLGNDCDVDEDSHEVAIKLNKASSSGKQLIVSKSVGVDKPVVNKTAPTNAVASSRVGGPKELVPKNRKQAAKVQEEKSTRDSGGDAEKGPRQSGSGSRGFRRDWDGPLNRRNYNRNNRNRFAEEKDKEDKTDAEIREEETVPDTSENDLKSEEVKEGLESEPAKTEVVKEEENENAKDEEKTLTLAEWKALQAPREKPVFNIRKPGEGEVSSKLGKLVLKKREDDIGDKEEEEYEADDVYYPQRAGKMKLIKDVGFNTGYQKRRGGRFNPSARSGGGDGNARETNATTSEQTNAADKPRGRPRFVHRGGHQRPAQVLRIDDTSDFPTLG